MTTTLSKENSWIRSGEPEGREKMMYGIWAFLGAVLVGVGLPSLAEGAEVFYKVACPAVWPGSGRDDFPLTYATQWKHWEESITPATKSGFFEGAGPGDIQMDCAYGKGGAQSPLRVTVVLPGRPQRCHLQPFGAGMETAVCEVRPEADGSLGEVRWRVAEVIGDSTTFFGFGIGQSREQVFRAAERGDFFAEGETLSRMVMQRDDARLSAVIDPDTGRTTEIVREVPETEAGRKAFPDDIIFRFGFNFRREPFSPLGAGLDAGKRIWRSPDGTVAVELRPELPRGLAGSLHLVRRKPGG